MVRLRRLAGALRLLGWTAITACHPTTSVRMNVVNPSTVPVVVDVTNLDEQARPLRADSKRLPAATVEKDAEGKVVLGPDGQPVLQPASVTVEWTDVPRLSRLKLEYRPETSTARFRVEPSLVVHDSEQPFVKDASIGSLRLYEQAVSEASISQLGSELGGGERAALAERLVDVLPLLGSAVVATFKMNQDGAEAAQVHGSVHLQDVKYEHAPLVQLRSAITIDRQVMSRVAAAVPVYETLATQIDAGNVCHLAWSINHTPVPNAVFDVGAALEAAPLTQLKSLRNLLVAYPESTVAVVANMHVVESASFGVTPGRALQANDDSGTASVFTGTSAYAFDVADEKYVSIPSLVVNVWYNKQSDRSSTLTLLERLIKNKSAAVPPAPSSALSSLREAVRNGFAPTGYSDSTITREALRQPRM